MAEFLGTVLLGGLYNNSVIQPRPTKPWTNSAAFGSGGNGNIPSMSGSMANYSLGDTPALEANKLKWHKIKDGDKTLLVCDRNILASVSWDDLNAENLIFGKIITIDNKYYKLRVLTGGNNYRSGSDAYSGGSPATNEWDRFITREEVIAGLPAPVSSDLNTSTDETDRLSAHNQFWNWGYFYSWAQETYIGNASYRSIRGYDSARYCNSNPSSYRTPGFGWRPVLEEFTAPVYLGTVLLGGLYNNSVIQPRPTKPWINSAAFGSGGNGNIPGMSGSMANYLIGDTPALEANKLKWHKIKNGIKTLFICDRNILTNVSWNDLNAENLILGKTITIDGKQYDIRALAGGDNYRNASDPYAGGSPATNEWDRFITNEDIITGLPIPTASNLDSAANEIDRLSDHNQFWNWGMTYSWVQEKYTGNTSRVIRGNASARSFSYGIPSTRGSNYGWRPVLEVLNTAPTISGADSDLGVKNSNFAITYTVDDADESDILTVKEYVDGVLLKTTTPAERNFSYTMNVNTLPLQIGSHNAKITVSDGVAGVVERIYTFSTTAKKFTLTLNKPININDGDFVVCKELMIKSDENNLALTSVQGKNLTYAGLLTNGNVNLEMASKNARKVKKIVYTIY